MPQKKFKGRKVRVDEAEQGQSGAGRGFGGDSRGQRSYGGGGEKPRYTPRAGSSRFNK